MDRHPHRTQWSGCSKYKLMEMFDKGLDYCLHNMPETKSVYQYTAECGNGFIDKGEECDCGNAPASVR